MKKYYTSPAVTVEELYKADVLCESTERNLSGSTGTQNKTDNINQTFKTLGDISSLL